MKCPFDKYTCIKHECGGWLVDRCAILVIAESLKAVADHKTLIQDQADMHGITPPDNSDCTWGGGIAEKTT